MNDPFRVLATSNFDMSQHSENKTSKLVPASPKDTEATNLPKTSTEGQTGVESTQMDIIHLLEVGEVHDALCIWIKWLVLPSPAMTSLPSDLHQYFQTLLSAFLQSKSSNHQKFCLAIIRASVDKLEDGDIDLETIAYEHSRRAEYRRAYEAYCNFFEIIVMGRYINQIQECLELLPSTKEAETSLVCEVWWLLLFRAALHSNNEQIRRILGIWLLENNTVKPTSSSYVKLVQSAFFDSLLEWATHGQMAYKSIVRNGRAIVSKHGELLSMYCERQAKEHPEFVEHTYQWLSKRTESLNQHNTVYVLRGLQHASSTLSICTAAAHIANTVKFSPLQRLVTRKYCFKMIEKYLLSGAQHDESLKRVFESLKTEIHGSQHMLDGDMGPFFVTNTQSEYNHEAVLERLVAGGYLAKDELGITIDWERLIRHEMYQSLWKLFAESWPFWISSAFAHLPGNAATDFAADCIANFFRLSRKKTFLWVTTAKALRRLSLENPALLQHPAVETAILRFVNEPPNPTPEHLLDVTVAAGERDENGDPLYSIFANESLGHAYVFDILSRLSSEDKEWGLSLLDELLGPWQAQKEPIPVASKWKRRSQLQGMIVLLHSCVHTQDEIEKYYSAFYTLLAGDPNPRNRFLLEWAVLYLASRPQEAETYTDAVLKALEDADPSNPNPKLVTSEIKLAVQLVLHLQRLEKTQSTQRCERLLIILTTLIGSSRVAIRFEAQALFPTIYDIFRQSGVLEKMGCAPAFRSVYNFVIHLDKYKTPPESRILGAFDIDRDMNLATLFEGGYMYIPQAETPLLFASDLQEVLDADPADLIAKRPEACLPIGTIDETAAELVNKLRALTPVSEADDAALAAAGPLQTKSLAPDFSFLGLEAAEPTSKHGSGPILIGTLLDAAVNLGGLSRAANVFGCHSLHVPSISVLSSSQFKTVSVNSQLHLDVQETTLADLLSRLRALKREGWTIVGLEQTNDSKVIGVLSGKGKVLPRKAVIVMGAEKTGIPADILFECDLCVEIQQWGVTRSLNVQTAAACVLFEWRREWGDGSAP